MLRRYIHYVLDFITIGIPAYLIVNGVGAYLGFWGYQLDDASGILFWLIGLYAGTRLHRWYFYLILKADPMNQVNSDAFWRSKS